MKKIVVLVSNDLSYDQRVAKTCTWWHERGFDVTLIGFEKKGSLPISFPYRALRFSNPFQQGVLFYAWIQFRLFFYLLLHRADAVWCNDLDTLCPAVSLKFWKKWKIMYDAHECFTESVGLMDNPIKRKVWLTVERICMPKLDHCFTVSNGIREFYQNKYNRSFQVMRNLPDLSISPVTAEKPKAWEGKQVLFYHGVFNAHRGLDELIDAMPLLPEIILVLVGYGEHEVVLKDKVKLLHLEEKVFFSGPMNYPNILGMLHHADLGIALEKPVSESFKWALPNKIFDYARMGLPFVTLGNPEVSSVLDKYPMGWVTQSLKPGDLSSFILQCLKDITNHTATFRAAQKAFLVDNNAEKEWKILESIVE